MSKTLTVTITDIPDDLYEYFWKDTKRLAKKECGGFVVKETDSIIINCDLIGTQVPHVLSDLFASVSTGHMLYQFDQEYNQQP